MPHEPRDLRRKTIDTRTESLQEPEIARSPKTGAGGLFTPDARFSSVWLDDIVHAEGLDDDLPANADVVIVGAGYTGLNAALEIVRGGQSVVVLDAGDPGGGCSTRNGGQISTSVKPQIERLARHHGEARAKAIHAEGYAALDWIEAFVELEGIECDFSRAGRFHAAHTPRHFEALAKEADAAPTETQVVPRAEQHRELGTDGYFGGVVLPSHASLHPAKYFQGLLRRALAAGAVVVPRCRAAAISRARGAFHVQTGKGSIIGRDLIVATNGYTTGVTPWMQRRVIPIGSYVIATEPVPPEVVDRLFPTNRVFSDTRKVVYYYRLSPDRRRVVFGGRVSAGESDPRITGPRLHAEMSRLFPELSGVRISHSWSGTVAYSFDELAHCGVHEGMHYAMSYCGSGVSMASYLGMRMGQRVLGLPEGRTAFDDLPFPTRPLYSGRPWFLPAVVGWYRLRDRVECALAARQT